jgi:hypothetical protein
VTLVLDLEAASTDGKTVRAGGNVCCMYVSTSRQPAESAQGIRYSAGFIEQIPSSRNSTDATHVASPELNKELSDVIVASDDIQGDRQESKRDAAEEIFQILNEEGLESAKYPGTTARMDVGVDVSASTEAV